MRTVSTETAGTETGRSRGGDRGAHSSNAAEREGGKRRARGQGKSYRKKSKEIRLGQKRKSNNDDDDDDDDADCIYCMESYSQTARGQLDSVRVLHAVGS